MIIRTSTVCIIGRQNAKFKSMDESTYQAITIELNGEKEINGPIIY